MSEDKRFFSLFPKPLMGCVEPMLRPLLKTQGLAGSRILTEWESIMGAKLAAYSYPEKLSFPRGGKTDGTLTISVASGFATELQHMQPIILERLAQYFGYQAVSRVVISHSWAPSSRPQNTKPSKPTLTKDSASLVDDVEDGDLKDALKSLANTLSGQKS